MAHKQTMINLIRSNPKITLDEMAHALGYSPSGIWVLAKSIIKEETIKKEYLHETN